MAGCEWKRVFEHAADGSVIYGSLADLIKAVKAGADVQVRYYRSANVAGYRRVEWHRTVHSVTVADSNAASNSIVSCMVTDIPDTTLQSGEGRRFISDPFAYEWQAYNTTGARHTVKFDQQTHAVLDSDIDRIGLAWYVRCYRTTFWFDQIVSTVGNLLPFRSVRDG